jgi:arginase
LPQVRSQGITSAALEAVALLSRAEIDGFWIHVDADCLDDAVMPAVDYRTPDGLTPQELATVLEIALDSGKAMGLEVTVYNPDLDSDGRAGELLTDVLADALEVA